MRSTVIGFTLLLLLFFQWCSFVPWNVSLKRLKINLEVLQQHSRLKNYIRNSTSQSNIITPYTMTSIANLIQSLVLPGLVIIYDPSFDKIHVYSISNDRSPSVNFCSRCRLLIPALARALWKFPRLSTNNSHVQLFTSDYDFPYVNMDSIVRAKTSRDYFSPWIQFGSNFQDSTILPNVQTFPFIDFLHCLREWNLYQIRMGSNTSDRIESLDSALNQTCYLFTIAVWNNDTWDNLIPQIIWRGSDFPFLHTFRQQDFKRPYSVPEVPFFPRRLAVQMAEATNYTWLNAKIQLGSKNLMDIEELSKYKYHIDLGGAGGTTWTGTISKLAMPGVLFHHETPAKDWFYDSVRPWEHYIPIRTDLSDLREKYEWAESNSGKVKEISLRATQFVQSLLSFQNIQKIYEAYLGKQGILSNIVDAYNEENPKSPSSRQSLRTILMEYQQKWNLNLSLVSLCSRNYCDVRKDQGSISRISIHPGLCEKHIRGTEMFGIDLNNCTPSRKSKL